MSYLSEAKKYLFVHDKFIQVGFLVDDLASSQIAYLAITNANKWLNAHMGVNISIFCEESYIPCVHPLFSRFNLKDTLFFDGHLIATSSKMIDVLESTRAKKYFYINDLEYLRKNSDVGSWERMLSNNQIRKFARSKDYRDELVNKGFSVHEKIVEDFEINDILEIINE